MRNCMATAQCVQVTGIKGERKCYETVKRRSLRTGRELREVTAVTTWRRRSGHQNAWGRVGWGLEQRGKGWYHLWGGTSGSSCAYEHRDAQRSPRQDRCHLWHLHPRPWSLNSNVCNLDSTKKGFVIFGIMSVVNLHLYSLKTRKPCIWNSFSQNTQKIRQNLPFNPFK